MIEKDVIINLLNEKYRYPKHMLEPTANKLLNLDSKLAKYFEDLVRFEDIPDIVIEGYTVEKLMEKEHMNVISAFITLDTLLKEPDIAKKALDYGIHNFNGLNKWKE